MKLSKLFVSSVLAIAGVAFSTASLADKPGIYIGLGAGSSFSNVQNLSTGATTQYTMSGVNALVGYRISEGFAIELESIDFGKITTTAVDLTMTGVGVSAVGTVPLGEKFSFFGRVGMTTVTSTLSANPGWVLLVPAEESKSGVSYGFGGEINFTPNVALRLSLDSHEYSVGAGLFTGRVGTYGATGIFKF